MKTYKGFNQDLTCRGMKYEEGKTYELPEGEKPKACKNGFHACEYPLDMFSYYAPSQSVYHEVEQDGEICRHVDDSKIASSKITIGAKLDIRGLVKAAIEYTKSRCTTEHTDPKLSTAGDRGAATAGDRGAATAGICGAATAGDCGAATAGDRGAATAGDCGAATAGDCGAATAGNYGAATAGDRGAATAGICGAATAGNYGAATAGDYGAATAGDYGAATSRGSSEVGKKGIACARTEKPRAKGGLNSVLVLVKEDVMACNIRYWKAIRIDGKKWLPDTWYTLDEKGKVIKAD